MLLALDPQPSGETLVVLPPATFDLRENLEFSRDGRRQALALVPLLLTGLTPAWAQTDLSDLARIRASGVLKVAVYKDNAPLSSGPNNDMQGLYVALAQALARQMNLTLSLLPFDAGENMNDDLRNMVWRGHYLGYGPADVMLQVPVDRHLMAENRQVLIFAPYMRQVLVVMHDKRKLAEMTSPEDLKGLPLAAERGSGAASVLMGGAGNDRFSINQTMVTALQQRGIRVYADIVMNHMANEAGQRADLNFPGARVRSVYASDPARWERQRLFGDDAIGDVAERGDGGALGMTFPVGQLQRRCGNKEGLEAR
jgi:ABC-type amino acid transport substrate-binding protein